MKLKTFRRMSNREFTTFDDILKLIEGDFNTWSSQNENCTIISTDVQVLGSSVVMFVFYSLPR